MDVKTLKQYKYINLEIENLEKQIRKLDSKKEIVIDSVKVASKRRLVIEGIEKDSLKLTRLKENRNKLLDLKEEIEDYIKKIPFLRIKQIFQNRHLEGLTWAETGSVMGEEPESLRKAYNRYLKNYK